MFKNTHNLLRPLSQTFDDTTNYLELSKKKQKKIRKKCSEMVHKKMNESGAPGMVVGVSVDGVLVWSKGFGYSDVENSVLCSDKTVMRIASISKSFTSVAAAKLWEGGKLDFDKSVQHYLPDYPQQNFDGNEVKISLHNLLTHMSGVRHYTKVGDKEKPETVEEFKQKEYFSRRKYKSVTEALEMFKNDKLFHPPGSKFLYTTHGWTLVSAILEKASGQGFIQLMHDLFQEVGMFSTFPDHNDVLIYNRSKYYVRNRNGKLINAPYVDNSYKWAGGGFVSTVGDILKLGNAMMYCYQYNGEENMKPGILKPSTVRLMWKSASKPDRSEKSLAPKNESYGLGWYVYPETENYAYCPESNLEIVHTGGAIGASSVLYIRPGTGLKCVEIEGTKVYHANGIAVSIITNIDRVGLTQLARNICDEFAGIKDNQLC